jgi:hypothetical protein
MPVSSARSFNMATRAQRPVFWQAHINGWRASGLSIDRYCAQNGISKTSFSKWRRRLAIDAPAKRSRTPSFVQAVVIEPATGLAELSPNRPPSPSTPIRPAEPRKDMVPVIEIQLRGDRTIRVVHDFDEAVLTRLVALLENLPLSVPCTSTAQSVQG